MRRANLGILAGTAMALVLAAATTAGAQRAMPMPDTGGPRSMTKPSMPEADDSMRNRPVAPRASAQPTRRNVAEPSSVPMFPATTPPPAREPSRAENANASVPAPAVDKPVETRSSPIPSLHLRSPQPLLRLVPRSQASPAPTRRFPTSSRNSSPTSSSTAPSRARTSATRSWRCTRAIASRRFG